TFLTMSLYLLACGGENKENSDSNLVGGRNEQSKIEKNSSKDIITTETIILMKVDGKTYSINSISQENSYLKFYSADSNINHNCDFETVCCNREERLTFIIVGVDGKEKDNLSGDVRLGETVSLATYKKGNLSISFTEGESNVEEVSAASGLVRLK